MIHSNDFLFYFFQFSRRSENQLFFLQVFRANRQMEFRKNHSPDFENRLCLDGIKLNSMK